MIRCYEVLILLAAISSAVLSVAPANAQNVGAIVLYTDADFTRCCIAGQPSGLVTIYAVHDFAPAGVTGSQFAVVNVNAGFSYVSEQAQNGTIRIGNASTGGTYSYGACVANGGGFYFLSMVFLGNGTAGTCSKLDVVPSPLSLSGEIEGVDCSNVTQVAGSTFINVNPDGTCICTQVDPGGGECLPVPTDATTWGRVKALYD